MLKIIILILTLSFTFNAHAAESNKGPMPKHEWSFNGITGTFDRAALQRGFKVYRVVCAGCHSMKLLYYSPNDEGEMFERPARPADRFVNPYLNDNEARANNNGAYPPDLSVITKARRYGEDYIYNLLMGYEEAPEGVEVGNGMYYNKWMDGNQIAMPAPILDGSVDYDDGTDNNAAQLSEDVVTFLKWSAEPELEVRKNLGIKVILFFLVLGTIVYLAKNRLWREVH